MRRTLRGNKENLKAKRRLRREMTPPEIKLWLHLRSKQLGTLKFRRQHGVGPYIVDFFCPEAGVVVEIDGDTHAQDIQMDRDAVRDAFLNGLGLRVIRYNNRDVLSNLDGVLDDLSRKLSGCLPPPTPPCKGGEKAGNGSGRNKNSSPL